MGSGESMEKTPPEKGCWWADTHVLLGMASQGDRDVSGRLSLKGKRVAFIVT